jgi:hypothetical protein
MKNRFLSIVVFGFLLLIQLTAAVDSKSHIHLVHQEDKSGNQEIFYIRTTDGGLSWTRKRLTWTFGISYQPAIAADSGSNIHVVWQEYFRWPNYEIYYKKSTDGGASWIVTKRLSWSAGTSINPDVVVDTGGNIHVVWQDDTIGNNDVYYKRSTNGGVSWSTKKLSWNSESK